MRYESIREKIDILSYTFHPLSTEFDLYLLDFLEKLSSYSQLTTLRRSRIRGWLFRWQTSFLLVYYFLSIRNGPTSNVSHFLGTLAVNSTRSTNSINFIWTQFVDFSYATSLIEHGGCLKFKFEGAALFSIKAVDQKRPLAFGFWWLGNSNRNPSKCLGTEVQPRADRMCLRHYVLYVTLRYMICWRVDLVRTLLPE